MHPTGKLTFDFEPGTGYNYSGEGYVYLSRALESKFNKSLAQLSDSLIFKPLDMKDSRYYWDENMDESRFAFWHNASGNLHENATSKDRDVNAGGSLLTTVEDYCKFGIEVINGAGLSDDLYKDMIETDVQKKTHCFQGLGWSIIRDLPDSEYALEQYGSDIGVRTLVILLPKSKRGIVLLTNGEYGKNIYLNVVKEAIDSGSLLLNYMYKNTDNPATIALSDDKLKQYVGTYENINGDLFRLTSEPGILRFAKNNEAPQNIYPYAEDNFFFEYFDINIEFQRGESDSAEKLVA